MFDILANSHRRYMSQVPALDFTTLLPNAQRLASYAASLTGSGGYGTYTFQVVSGSPPVGILMSSGAVFSGTAPATLGVSNFDVRMWDISGAYVTKSLSITVVNLSSGGSAWKYKNVNYSDTTDYSGVAYNDSAWPTGNAPFASQPWSLPTNYGFSGTPATTFLLNTRLWVRKHVTLAAPLPVSLTLEVFQDNGFDLWVNGSYIASNYQTYGGYYSYNVSASALVVGDNVLAVRVDDDNNNGNNSNDWAWFDCRIIANY